MSKAAKKAKKTRAISYASSLSVSASPGVFALALAGAVVITLGAALIQSGGSLSGGI